MEAKDWIDLASAIGSVIVAVGTGALAWATFRLAKFTKATVADAEKALKQADEHHQENLRPFCAIEFSWSDRAKPFGAEFPPFPSGVGPGQIPITGKPHISIKGRLYNKGLGPAKNVVVYLNSGNSVDDNGKSVNGRAFWLTHPVVVCSIISAGESIELDITISEQNIATVVKDGGRIPTQLLEFVANDAYEVVLRYQDIFDKPFRAVHAKGFPQNLPVETAVAGGDTALEAQQSSRQNVPTPVFLKGEQPWSTLADMRQPPPGWLGSVEIDSQGDGPLRHDF
jgi:hypothetical protein